MSWWLLLLGGTLWAPVLIAIFRRTEVTGCPECGHDCGPDDTHCAEIEDCSGWASDTCDCQSDWHWNYASVRT